MIDPRVHVQDKGSLWCRSGLHDYQIRPPAERKYMASGRRMLQKGRLVCSRCDKEKPMNERSMRLPGEIQRDVDAGRTDDPMWYVGRSWPTAEDVLDMADDEVAALRYQERDLSQWGAMVSKTAMHQQWRACGKDKGDACADPGEWRYDRAQAETDLREFEQAELPYDETWLETRWLTAVEKVTE